MAGLSVTAIAIILAIGYFYILVFSEIISYFTVSFVALMLSWYSETAWSEKGLSSFVGNILTNTGILSLSSGFLEFFYRSLPMNQFFGWLPIPLSLGIFVVIIWVISFRDLSKHIKQEQIAIQSNFHKDKS